jgi:hypothetical protein
MQCVGGYDVRGKAQSSQTSADDRGPDTLLEHELSVANQLCTGYSVRSSRQNKGTSSYSPSEAAFPPAQPPATQMTPYSNV